MDSVSIALVLEHYGAFVSVPETGWRSIKCPFHADRVASGSVNLELNCFRCHGCGMSGDAIKLIERNENLGFADAIEFAREVLGQVIEEIPRTASKRRPRRSPWDTTLFG